LATSAFAAGLFTQRKLLTACVADIWRWAKRVVQDTPAGPAPEPSADRDLTSWRQ
jgi:hypothetical protein